MSPAGAPQPRNYRPVCARNPVIAFELDELALAYALTIHKSQGSEFPAVVVPVLNSHHIMLQRNLLYTAITRARRLVVLVGDPKAIAVAVRNDKVLRRHTGLTARLIRCSTPS